MGEGQGSPLLARPAGLVGLVCALTGTAAYDVFGAVRASSGSSSVFGFTGEQLDSETGFTFLRARYLNPALGRFLSADSVQPNGPGTQGYNLYAYVANNPTTWVDPSGHFAQAAVMTAFVIRNPYFITVLIPACVGSGFGFGVCMTAVTIGVTIPVLVCALTPGCMQQAWDWGGKIAEFGSSTFEGVGEWTIGELQDATDTFPNVPGVTTLFSGSDTYKGKSAPGDFAKQHGLESWKVGKAIERLKGKSGVPLREM